MKKLNRNNLQLNITNTFILGVVWGLLEIFADVFLAPNNIFTRGLIFSFIAVLLLIFSKQIINYRFSLLLTAGIALLIIFASRGFSINILIAIFSEALIAEVLFLSLKINHITSMAVGALIFLYSFIHGLIFHGTLPGSYIDYLYRNMFTGVFGTGTTENINVMILFWGLISIIAGLLSGWLSWRITIKFSRSFSNGIKKYFIAG